MCGIAGWYAAEINVSSAATRLNRMVDAVSHRGPDGQGVWIGKHAALGHTRLAVIDLETGEQPMRADGAHIVFNGEIYNYRALRDDLQRSGALFQTRSDTEVILRLYLRDGVSGFKALRGMYAFAIWHEPTSVGLIARDPVGIKPLFVANLAGGGIAFASECKALLAGRMASGELNPQALHLLMNFRYLPGDHSLFRGIQQLAPGEILQWRPAGALHRARIPMPEPSDADIAQELRMAVHSHLTADVEVGCYLSGGIDSAAVAALSERPGMRTFTLAVGDHPLEAKNAARSAELLGLQNDCSAPAASVSHTLPTLIRHLEVPKVNAWQVFELARFTRGHVKVALSGMGGDELFFGYNLHALLHRAARLGDSLPHSLLRFFGQQGSTLARLVCRTPWSEPERALRALANLGSGWSIVYGLLRNVWDAPAMRRWLYGPRMLDEALPSAFDYLGEHWPEDSDPVSAAARFEWRHKLVNDLLWQEDRASMAVGLEVRVPFLDTTLASTVHNLDRDALMPGGKLKWLLREQLHNVLPAEILDRPKSGFQVHAPEFFRSHLRTIADRYLDIETVHKFGLFNPNTVQQLRQLSTATAHRWHYFILYLILGTHIWIETFNPSR